MDLDRLLQPSPAASVNSTSPGVGRSTSRPRPTLAQPGDQATNYRLLPIESALLRSVHQRMQAAYGTVIGDREGRLPRLVLVAR